MAAKYDNWYELICLSCKLPGECNHHKPGCKMPRTKKGEVLVRSPLLQHGCGAVERIESVSVDEFERQTNRVLREMGIPKMGYHEASYEAEVL